MTSCWCSVLSKNCAFHHILCNKTVFTRAATKVRITRVVGIGVAKGSPGDYAPHKFFKYQVILCFERRYPKQNTVASLKSNFAPPPKFFCPPKRLWFIYASSCWWTYSRATGYVIISFHVFSRKLPHFEALEGTYEKLGNSRLCCPKFALQRVIHQQVWCKPRRLFYTTADFCYCLWKEPHQLLQVVRSEGRLGLLLLL